MACESPKRYICSICFRWAWSSGTTIHDVLTLKGDLFSVPERGKDLGGFPRLTALKVEGVTPDSHVYMSCKKMVMKVHGKYPGSVRVCLL